MCRKIHITRNITIVIDIPISAVVTYLIRLQATFIMCRFDASVIVEVCDKIAIGFNINSRCLYGRAIDKGVNFRLDRYIVCYGKWSAVCNLALRTCNIAISVRTKGA